MAHGGSHSCACCAGGGVRNEKSGLKGRCYRHRRLLTPVRILGKVAETLVCSRSLSSKGSVFGFHRRAVGFEKTRHLSACNQAPSGAAPAMSALYPEHEQGAAGVARSHDHERTWRSAVRMSMTRRAISALVTKRPVARSQR